MTILLSDPRVAMIPVHDNGDPSCRWTPRSGAPQDLSILLEGQFRARQPVPETFTTLTEKEQQVFAAVARGLSNTEIAGQIFASESTVKTHVGAILRKLDLRDRVQIVVFAHEHGLA